MNKLIGALLFPGLPVAIILGTCFGGIWLMVGTSPQWYVERKHKECLAYQGTFFVERSGDNRIIHVACKGEREKKWVEYSEWEKGQ
jgi:hypothetical protein